MELYLMLQHVGISSFVSFRIIQIHEKAQNNSYFKFHNDKTLTSETEEHFCQRVFQLNYIKK